MYSLDVLLLSLMARFPSLHAFVQHVKGATVPRGSTTYSRSDAVEKLVHHEGSMTDSSGRTPQRCPPATCISGAQMSERSQGFGCQHENGRVLACNGCHRQPLL